MKAKEISINVIGIGSENGGLVPEDPNRPELGNKLDENGNMILFFIVTEFVKLLKYNSTKYSKLPVAEFIVEFISNVFELFNNEKFYKGFNVD